MRLYLKNNQRDTPVILTTQDIEIKRLTVLSQPRPIVCVSPILKIPITKKGLVEWLKV
jgi:hypothetical protein